MAEFFAAVEGWNRVNGAEKPEPPSDDRFDDMLAQLEERKNRDG